MKPFAVILSITMGIAILVYVLAFAKDTSAPRQNVASHPQASQPVTTTTTTPSTHQEAMESTTTARANGEHQADEKSLAHPLPEPIPATPDAEHGQEQSLSLDDVGISSLLERHATAMRKGDMAQAERLEAALYAQRPLGHFPSFVRALRGTNAEEFRARARLLKLLDPLEYQVAWDVFIHDWSRYAKTTGSMAWQEGEVEYLCALMRVMAPDLWRFERGLGMLEELLLGNAHAVIKQAGLAGLALVAPSHQEEYVAPLRRVLAESQDPEVTRQAALLLLRFTPDEAGRVILLDAQRGKAWELALLATALDEGLVSVSVLIPYAERVLMAANAHEDGAGLVRALEAQAPEEALALARRSLTSEKSPTPAVQALWAIVARRGSEGERDTLQAFAEGSSRSAKPAAEALIAAHQRARIAMLFEQAALAPVKALAIRELAQGNERVTWLERGMAKEQPAAVRSATLALFDPTTASERAWLMRLAETEEQPYAREQALIQLARLSDPDLIPFFEARAGNDAQASLRALAQNAAERLHTLQRRRHNRDEE